MRTPDPKYALLAAQLAKSHAETLARIAKDDAAHKWLHKAQDGKCALCHVDDASIRAYNRAHEVDSLLCYDCSQATAMSVGRLRLAIGYIEARTTAPT